MALIRSAQLAPMRTRLSEVRVTAAGRDGAEQTPQGIDSRSAREILREEVEAQVRTELSAQLQELYEAERARARADGYAEGLSDGRAVAAGELERVQEQLRSTVDGALSALEEAHQVALTKLELSVGEVAFAAVCRWVSHAAGSQAWVLDLVEHACAQLRTDTFATVRLHPRDIRTLGDLLADGEIRIGSLGLRVVPDESLQLGGCIIEAASGQYDGGLDSQLRRLHTLLTGPQAAERSAERAAVGEA